MIKDILKSKLIIFIFLLTIFAMLLNALFYYNTDKGLKAAIAEDEKVKSELSLIEGINPSLLELQKQEIELKGKYDNMCQLFPKEVTQEAALHALKIQSDLAKINITNITFGTVEAVDEFKGESLSVKFTFKGSYTAIRNFIDFASRNKQKISIRQMTFSGFGTNLSGNAEATFNGYKNSGGEFVPPIYSEIFGKDDLFRIFSGGEQFIPQAEQGGLTESTTETEQIKKGNYDFYMVMNKYSDDAPNIIVGKNKESEITADGNKTNWVNIYFVNIEGKLYYRYRTEDGVFPKSKMLETFTPVMGDVITINIASNEIASANDKSKMQLNVYNDCGRKVLVTVSGAGGKARVSKNVIHGDVELKYE